MSDKTWQKTMTGINARILKKWSNLQYNKAASTEMALLST
jgi:hypothetical protein